MKRMIIASVAAVAAFAIPSSAQVSNGAQATNFRLTDVDGRNVALSDFKGKLVVLEWHNPGCPFVVKHYKSGNMQKTQNAVKAAGGVWLTINSGAPGKQGHMSGAEAKKLIADQNSTPTHYLLDPRGIVGKGYDAKTTPHMYVINPAGALVYQGAIDDKPTANVADIANARNHVLAAVEEVRAGKPVSVATSRAYGCTVKYPDA